MKIRIKNQTLKLDLKDICALFLESILFFLLAKEIESKFKQRKIEIDDEQNLRLSFSRPHTKKITSESNLRTAECQL